MLKVRINPETQTYRVWQALRDGARTSREIADVSGVPMPSVSALLYDLRKLGLAEIVRKGCIQFGTPGRPSNHWRAVERRR
jgi:predicted ArsR family transcriptional regulator